MKIKDLKLIPPSKRTTAFFINFMKEHEKGLKAIKTLAEIKKICNNNNELKGNFNLVDCDKYKLGKHNLAQKIIAKINEVENVENN